MKNILKYSMGAFMTLLMMASCDPQESSKYALGTSPDPSELSFTATPSASNPNIIELKNTSSFKGGVIYWEMGNGAHATGQTAEARFPFANTYKITMQVYNEGAPVTITQDVTIANNDPAQINKEAIKLAGGLDGNKTWVLDRTHDGHFGVGPAGGNGPDWWSCPAEGKAGCSLYENEFTFNLDGNYNVVWTNKGYIYTNGAGKDALGKPSKVPPAGDFDVAYTPKASYLFTIDDGKIKLSDDGFFGHYVGTSTYKILNVTEDEFYIMCESALESGNGWWYRFVPKK